MKFVLLTRLEQVNSRYEDGKLVGRVVVITIDRMLLGCSKSTPAKDPFCRVDSVGYGDEKCKYAYFLKMWII